MKIVVDSNIVFSAILNTQSNIGQLIINGSQFFNFYTVGLLKNEILEHKTKILKITGFNDLQFSEIFELICNKIHFVDEILLSNNEINKAFDLVSDIDEDDALFVALNNHLTAYLWTGDKKLINGLHKKHYSHLITTDDIFKIFLEKSLKKQLKRK